MKTSAGILLYRKNQLSFDIILVHPSGKYNKNADWSMPKGKLEPDETPLEAAIRETSEEIGITLDIEDIKPISLGESVYKTKKKKVICFALKLPDAKPEITSWEIDQVKWVDIKLAREIVHEAQIIFINKLAVLLNI